MKVWIDLSNSPHALFFAPVAAQLTRDGHSVLVTVRDHAQTVELATERWDEVEVLGGQSPSGRSQKVISIASRVGALATWAKRHRPDIALSHNSYAQIVAARLAGVRAVTAMDYEHQPANHLAFRAASLILLPAALRSVDLRKQGASSRKVRYYGGFKEELYLADFEPIATADAGFGRHGAQALVVARTPPVGALYHRTENERFVEAVRRLDEDPRCRLVILPRNEHQRRELRSHLGPGSVVADGAIDSRSLLIVADLFVGAGGTMTREAALLGVPTYSLFAGKRPRVDEELERSGHLRYLAPGGQVVVPPHTSDDERQQRVRWLRERGPVLVREFIDLALGGAA